ncbi:MAG: hypothetical protein LBP33_11615 [Candidatus Adiutrix sp.]|jgi:hypothetical protein|nr:hypothetical protein [Candidatus Adiutrix sp.]
MTRISKIWILILAALMLGLGGCRNEPEKSREAGRGAEEAAALAGAARRQAALDRAAGEALNAAQEDFFRPSPEEAAFLNAFVAVNRLGAPNGYFTNQDGISGYFQDYQRPFNFAWQGGTVEIQGFDGRRYRVIDGPGELVLKHVDDELLLQRYQGESRAGFWQGYGRLWTRNREAGGHNYFFYQGGFAHDRFDGRGVMSNYNFNGRGGHPFRYEGQFRNGVYHGQGLISDLANGQLRYKGLWADGQPYQESRDLWESEQLAADLEEGGRQYGDLLMTDRLEVTAYGRPAAGPAPLTVILPEGARRPELRDARRRLRPARVTVRHPVEKDGAGRPLEVEALEENLTAADYPATLTLSYDDQGGRRQYLRFTAKRPFTMQLENESQAREESEEELLKKPLDGELEKRLEQLEDRLRRERLSSPPAR